MTRLRLDGLDADNLLAFLALLGLLRSLETARPDWRPRVCWDLDHPPLRPILQVAAEATLEEVSAAAADGVARLAETYQFGDRERLKLTVQEARGELTKAALNATTGDRRMADLWSSLTSDVGSNENALRTPFCLLDVARTAFLKTLSVTVAPGAASKSNSASAPLIETLSNALFQAWTWSDKVMSFRWDPVEDSRHAYRWSAPTDERQGVQAGANILAAIALPLLAAIPLPEGSHFRLLVDGGRWSRREGETEFSFAWPIWRDFATLAGIRALLRHPDLYSPDKLQHIGVHIVYSTRRIRNDRYMNFTRGQVLGEG